MYKKLLVLLLILPLVGAQNLEFGVYRINYIDIEIQENGFARVEEEIVVDMPRVSILLPSDVAGLRIIEIGRALKYESTRMGDKQLIMFNPTSSFPQSEGKVLISYSTSHLTSKSGNIWTLEFSIKATQAHTEINIEFPPNSQVLSLEPDIPHYPKDLTTPLSLYPQKSDISFLCEYQTTQSPPSKSMDYLYWALIIILAILLPVIFIHALRRRKKKVKIKIEKGGKTIKESVLKMLDKREQEIVELIHKADEEVTQAYIYKSTGIPKATLSDLMKRLERRNILEREQDGRIKWIKLKNWIFD